MIKKPFVISIIAFLLFAPTLGFQQIYAQQSAEWVTFNSPEGGFSVLMPTKPEMEVKEVDSAVGKIPLHNFSSSTSDSYFIVSYSDYPVEAAADRREAVLDGVRDGVIKGTEAELVSEKKLTLSGPGGQSATSYPGREFLAKRTIQGNEALLTWRIYLVGRRLYQVAAVVIKTSTAAPDVQRFLASLQLTR